LFRIEAFIYFEFFWKKTPILILKEHVVFLNKEVEKKP